MHKRIRAIFVLNLGSDLFPEVVCVCLRSIVAVELFRNDDR
jgi:hypothetical protein